MIVADNWPRARDGGRVALLGLVVFVVGGCLASPDISEDRCVPGRSQACECASGESGHRVCRTQGKWGRCECR
ncbi:MAG: hypothetical protein ABEN55_20455, partial [Bradymonadaceae bacterium]